MSRQYLTFINYDNKRTRIPLPKKGFWWHDGTGRGSNHCVVGCYNLSDVFYIGDSGLASIAYCDSHAERRVNHTMLTGQIERGMWCIVKNGKLSPHPNYVTYFTSLQKSNPKQAIKLKIKLELYMDKILRKINKLNTKERNA